MASANDNSSARYSPQQPYYYPPSSAAGTSAEGASIVRHVRYADEDESLVRSPVKSRPEGAAVQRVGGGRSGKRIGASSGAGPSLGLSIWKSKNKEKRNGKKKSKAVLDDTSDDDQPQPAKKKPAEEIVYRGQAGGSRSGRGLSIPKPTPRSTDKSKSKLKDKLISSPLSDGSETGSILSLGLGVPAGQWEREMGIAPLSERTFNPETLHALRSSPMHSLPNLATTSQAGSSSMMSNSGSRLGAWSEEDEEVDGFQSDYRETTRVSPDRGSEETFRRHPPPQYSTIQAPNVDSRVYSSPNKRGGPRPLPLRPESPMLSPSSISPSSPQSNSPSSIITARAWPMPPRPAYAHSVSSGSSSSMPPTPPMHPMDLYARSGRSKSPGPGNSLGLSPHSPVMVPWGGPGLGIRSEGSLHAPSAIEIPGSVSGSSDDPGIISGVVSGVDAAGRPYQYTYQYQSAPGAPPSHGDLIAALTPPLRPGSAYPPPPPASLPPQVFQPPTLPQLPPQQRATRLPQQRPMPKRLVISGIGAPGANDIHFDFDRALNEMHLTESGDEGGHNRDDGNDSDVDPAVSRRNKIQRENQRSSQGGEKGRLDGRSSSSQRQGPDREREEAVIQWCRGFGEVLEVRRRGQGCLMVEFLKEGVVDTICRAQQVYIKGAGKVDLGWC